MTVTHVVLFKFKLGILVGHAKALCANFVGLQYSCLRPTDNRRYILSIKGGINNSPEGLQDGITHGFVVEFASAEDRDYYVDKDPSHKAFVKSIEGLVEKVVVVDFSEGVYSNSI
ncbi:stress responsive A/B barrel domain-containing protein [Immersiella caudata]|uniref:Stress responsive A/B barrel domain-containing protein n=1 Tax=Immersiella caudata TaxID=314043 RepID=A0AA40C2V5_9PEZI|nr:stress responsive A/B barrel domain-containing protein [Immersiella caudata]